MFKARESLGDLYITSVFVALEQKEHQKLETEKTRQIVRTANSIHLLGSPVYRVWEMYHRVFDTRKTPLSLVLAIAWFPLIISFRGMNLNLRSMFRDLKTPLFKVLHYHHTMLSMNLFWKNSLTVNLVYKLRYSNSLLVQSRGHGRFWKKR